MLIDAGNSRVKWTCFDVDTATATKISAKRYQENDKAKSVKALLADIKPDRIRMVHVLGVSFTDEIQSFCQKHQIQSDFVVSTAPCCGVTNGYDVPEQWGADRFVALIGAHQLYPDDDLIVIDAGTAVTIDGLDVDGQHLGGVIMPGLQLWSDTLIKNTQLPIVPIYKQAGHQAGHQVDSKQAAVFATSTKRGINSGSLHGLVGAIDHVCHVMENSMAAGQKGLKRILCGGDSRLLADYIHGYVDRGSSDKNYILNTDLVMHGLIIIENNNA